MPLIQLPSQLPDSRLAIWQTEESMEDLIRYLLTHNRADFIPPDDFRNQKRRMEWLATRCAFLQMHVNKNDSIYYDELGKPFLISKDGHLSISHAWPYVCLFFHETKSVGVDIEMMTTRIIPIARKFVNELELKWLSSPYNIRELYLIWAAKEAVFKMKGGGGIDFRKNLTLTHTIIQKDGVAVLKYEKNNVAELFNIYYQFLDSMILVYTIAGNT